MKRLARLRAEDDKDSNQILIFHLILDDEKMIHQEMLGYMSNGSEKYPMIVSYPTKPEATEQVVNFGDCCEDIASTNLFAKNIKVGEYFTFTENGIDYTYQITHLTDMI